MNDRKLSEEAGLDEDVYTWNQIQLERFAELIRADERDKCAQDYLQDCCDAVEAARLEEREACADYVTTWLKGLLGTMLMEHWEQVIVQGQFVKPEVRNETVN